MGKRVLVRTPAMRRAQSKAMKAYWRKRKAVDRMAKLLKAPRVAERISVSERILRVELAAQELREALAKL